MKDWKRLSHVKWDCKYHVIFVPKYRKKQFYGSLRKEIGGILRELFEHRQTEVLEGHAMPDHLHMVVSIPPKYSIAEVIGYVKGKSAIRIHRDFLGKRRNFTGFHFWGRGYCISTVGLNEKMILEYVRNQEALEKQEEQLRLF